MNEDDEDYEMDSTERAAHIASKLAEGAYHGEEDWKLLLALAIAISEIDELDDRELAGRIFGKLIDTLVFAHLHVLEFSADESGEQRPNNGLPPIDEDEIQRFKDMLFPKKDED